MENSKNHIGMNLKIFLKFSMYELVLRLTDLCEYCEKEIVMRRKLAFIVNEELIACDHQYDISKLREEITKKSIEVKLEVEKSTQFSEEIKEKYKRNLLKF